MNNRIIYIAKEESEEVRFFAKKCKNVFFSEIDGAKIQSGENFVQALSKAFSFFDKIPMATLEWCNDYLCDLEWITQESIILLISDFDVMLSNAPKTKENIIKNFEEIILPWWEGDIIGHMVGGIPKKFLVYLEM